MLATQNIGKRSGARAVSSTKMDDVVEMVFGTNGLLAQKFPGYQPRPGQVRLTSACRDVFRDRQILLAEGPVGVGKSLAYLVPAIAQVVQAGGKVVVVTSNIALQEQLVGKDLPLLQEVLPWPFTFAIAKGFSNYICKDALDRADTERMAGKRLPVFSEQAQLEAVLKHEWKRGDVSEFPQEMTGRVRGSVTIQSDDCLGKKCRYFEDCYAKQARKSYGSAQVIVTNYHLYSIDMAMRMVDPKHGLLPEHTLLVMDEVHNAPELCRSFFGDQVSFGSIKTLTAELDAKGARAERLGIPGGINPTLQKRIEKLADRFFSELVRLKSDKDRYQARLNKPGMIDGLELETALTEAASAYTQASAALLDDARGFLGKRAEKLLKKARIIRAARELSGNEWIYYLEGNEDRAVLCGEPLDVGKFLNQALWSSDHNPRGIVLCSATLATGTDDHAFDYAVDRLGLNLTETPVGEILVESPFDYSRATLCIPSSVAEEPNDRNFASDVARTVYTVAQACNGRTMALFTSYKNLQTTARYLAEQGGFRILEQGDLPRTELVRQLKHATEPTVLLGTDSFWEGVDVPGEALIGLVIDKLPFDHMEDPVLDAIKTESVARGDKWGWFNEYYVPKAVTKWKQGVGRLIRSVTDYGVVVCCDRRILGKGYGKKFLRALPRETSVCDKLGQVPGLLQTLKSGQKPELPRVW